MIQITTPVRPTLKKSSTGKYVGDLQRILITYLQRYLNSLGFGPLEVDGIFGLATEKSVKKLQTFYGLTVDGIVGQQTWSTIFNNL